MSLRLGLALSLSILLIGVASWYRLAPAQEIYYNEAAIKTVKTTDEEEAMLNSFLPLTHEVPPQEVKQPPSEPLTSTDIITRNLLLSYLNLESSGLAPDQGTIDTLASEYVEATLRSHVFTKAIILDINVVYDSEESVVTYSKALSNAYINSAKEMTTSGPQPSTTSYVPFVNSAAKIYSTLASAFKSMPVPTSFSSLQLELVNLHLSNQAAMKAYIDMETDPMKALAGLIALKENMEKERTVLEEIKKDLKDKWNITY